MRKREREKRKDIEKRTISIDFHKPHFSISIIITSSEENFCELGIDKLL